MQLDLGATEFPGLGRIQEIEHLMASRTSWGRQDGAHQASHNFRASGFSGSLSRSSENNTERKGPKRQFLGLFPLQRQGQRTPVGGEYPQVVIASDHHSRVRYV